MPVSGVSTQAKPATPLWCGTALMRSLHLALETRTPRLSSERRSCAPRHASNFVDVQGAHAVKIIDDTRRDRRSGRPALPHRAPRAQPAASAKAMNGWCRPALPPRPAPRAPAASAKAMNGWCRPALPPRPAPAASAKAINGWCRPALPPRPALPDSIKDDYVQHPPKRPSARVRGTASSECARACGHSSVHTQALG